MVDEAHERSISTDVVLGLLKKIQKCRPELRLIISSATIEAKSIASFFRSSKKQRGGADGELCPKTEPAIISVECTTIIHGRGFAVEINYVQDPVADYLQAAVSTVMLIHKQETVGDILVFLMGQDDIDAAVQLLNEEAQSYDSSTGELLVLPLYSGLSRADQDLIFSPTPRGKRKVIISTNIAEISLTLEGDHVTFLNVYQAFLQSGKSSKWCQKNFVNYHDMKKVLETREQLKRTAQRLGIVLKSCERDIEGLRKAIIAGFFENACRLEAYSHEGKYKTVRTSQDVFIHPSSVLFRVNPKWVVYHSLVSTDRRYMRNVVTTDPSWLVEAAPHFFRYQGPPNSVAR